MSQIWLLSRLQRIASPPARALVFFFSTPSFNHFLEQCITSYPSPLDDNAPFYAKVVLLLVAGAYEFLIFSGIVGSVTFAVSNARFYFALLILGELWDDFPSWPYEDGVLALLILSFAFRAKRFVRSMRRRSPQIDTGEAPNVWTVAVLVLWFNPALLYYTAFNLLSQYFPELFVSPIAVTWIFWKVMSPASHIFGYGQKFVKLTKGQDSTLWNSIWNRQLVKNAIILQFSIRFTEKLVSNIPKGSIRITFFAQSFTYWRSREDNSSSNRTETHLPSSFASKSEWKEIRRNIMWIVHLGPSLVNNYFSTLWIEGRELYTNSILPHWRAIHQRRIRHPNEINIQSGKMIKLLRIHPGFFNDPVRCELYEHILDGSSSHAYTAISYTWGEPILEHEIEVNGKPEESVKVTSSAYEVLRSLRSHFKPETIWIDAICINQANKEDKARQIPLMPEIYEGASQTIIWLGHSPNAALAIGAVERIFLLNRLNRLMDTRITYEISNSAARALQEMLDCKWYGRAWVVQEVVRSKHCITLRYGEESLSWEKFSWFSQAILRDDTLLNMISERAGGEALCVTALRNVQVIKRLSLLVSQDQPFSILFYLTQMLRSSTRFDASVKKDRVHAFLGLSGSASFTPNYDIPLRQLCIDLVLHMANSDPICRNQLDFLVHAGIGYETKEFNLDKELDFRLPSWVPNWYLETRALPLIGTDGTKELLHATCIDKVLQDAAQLESFGQTNFNPREPTCEEVALQQARQARDQMLSTLFNATPGTSSLCYFQGDTLTLRGNRIARIRWVGDELPKPGTKNISETLCGLATWARRAAIFSPHTYPSTTTCPRSIAFSHTLCHGFAGTELDLTFSITPQRLQNNVQDAQLSDTLFNVLCETPILVRDHGRDLDSEIGFLFKEFILARYQTWVGRVFGITESGLMGMFLAGTRRGDLVSVFHGLRVPFSIRPERVSNVSEKEPGYYALVGPAYVHGIMDGALLAPGCESDSMFMLK